MSDAPDELEFTNKNIDRLRERLRYFCSAARSTNNPKQVRAYKFSVVEVLDRLEQELSKRIT